MDDGPPRFPRGFTCLAVLGNLLGLFKVSRTGLSPSLAELSHLLPLPIQVPRRSPTTPEGIASRRFRLFPVRSPLLGESRLISFPPGTEMFQFPGFASLRLCIQRGDDQALPWPGFPIRTSTDRSLLSSSPWLFAANHVLHRLLAPRHSPFALCSLTKIYSKSISACSRYGIDCYQGTTIAWTQKPIRLSKTD